MSQSNFVCWNKQSTAQESLWNITICDALSEIISVDLMNIEAMFTELLLQSDSPKTDVYQGVAVRAKKAQTQSPQQRSLCPERFCWQFVFHQINVLGKLFYLPKKKPCGPKALTSQSAIVSCVVQQLC